VFRHGSFCPKLDLLLYRELCGILARAHCLLSCSLLRNEFAFYGKVRFGLIFIPRKTTLDSALDV